MRPLEAKLHSYSIVDDGESYKIHLVFLTEEQLAVNVEMTDREALDFCSQVSSLGYKAARFNQDAKELDEKRKNAHGA